MCLACIQPEQFPLLKGKEIKEMFSIASVAKAIGIPVHKLRNIPGSQTGNFLHTHTNEKINLSLEQMDEIVENAIAVVATGVDTRVDIWAIQWPNDYKPKKF